MSFRDQKFSERWKRMGDQAEAQFEAWAKRAEIQYARYGLDRAPFRTSGSAFINYTPDFVTEGFLYEVQGFGGDQTCKLKVRKLEALQQWDAYLPVRLFLYNATAEQVAVYSLASLLAHIIDAELRAFPEGTPYYAWSAMSMPGWVDAA